MKSGCLLGKRNLVIQTQTLYPNKCMDARCDKLRLDGSLKSCYEVLNTARKLIEFFCLQKV